MDPAASLPAASAPSERTALDEPAPRREALAGAAGGPLSAARVGERTVVVDVALDAEVAGWLEAVGLGVGQTLTVLRRGAFGGPLHVRTGSGGELALNATLARSILVAELPASGRVE